MSRDTRTNGRDTATICGDQQEGRGEKEMGGRAGNEAKPALFRKPISV